MPVERFDHGAQWQDVYHLMNLPPWQFSTGRKPRPGQPAMWSDRDAPPLIGARVLAHGKPGTVTCYGTSYGWLFVAVRIDGDPERAPVMTFGAEIGRLRRGGPRERQESDRV